MELQILLNCCLHSTSLLNQELSISLVVRYNFHLHVYLFLSYRNASIYNTLITLLVLFLLMDSPFLCQTCLFLLQVQGRDRMFVKYVAEELGLDGSYVPRTYIEQIQLEKLINDVMVGQL